MKQKSLVRGTVAALLISAMSISICHLHRADRAGGEEISLEEEELPTVVALRSSGLALVLSILAYLINPRWMRWSSLDLPTPLRWSGAGFGAACMPLAYWVLHTLGKNITPTVETREARADYRRALPPGASSPVHGRYVALRVGERRGGELVHGAGEFRGAGDASDPSTQRGREADRTLRGRGPRLHEAHPTTVAAPHTGLDREPWFPVQLRSRRRPDARKPAVRKGNPSAWRFRW